MKVDRMFGRTAIIIMILIMVAPVSPLTTGKDSVNRLVPDPDFDPSAGVDVPTWREGDYWNYTTDFSISYLGLNIPFSGWMNMSVVLTTLDFTYTNDPVYVTNIVGNITGRLKIDLLGIDERIYIDLSGYIWSRIQDLSMYRLVTNATVSGTQSSLNGEYPFGYEYNPPLEEYDFPLIPRESWEVNVSARAPFGSSGDIIDIHQNMSCGDTTLRTVPSGVFLTYPVGVDGIPSLYYNDTVGNTVERVFTIDLGTMTQTIQWLLRDYSRAREENRIIIRVVSDEPVWAGSTFNVRGDLLSGNTVVTLMFPGGRVAATIPLIGPVKSFTRILRAPMYPDNSPTSFDHGSFGILAVVGLLEELDVCTVTTKAVDVMVNSSSIAVEHTGEGTSDDLFTARIRVYDPLNYGVSECPYQLLDGNGSELHNGTINDLEARSSVTFSVSLGTFDPGEHTLILSVDPLDQVDEYNETNNMVSLNFTVKERPLLSMNSTISPGNITVFEGEWVNISVYASRGDASIPSGNWTVDDRMMGATPSLNLFTDFTGELSSAGSPFIITYRVNSSYIFPDENGTLTWNLTVVDVDRGPIMESMAPEGGHLEMNEGSSMNFTATASDPDGEIPLYEWYINGIKIRMQGDDTTFRLITSFTGPNSSSGSPFNITVVISNPNSPALNISIKWTVVVLDVDRSPIFNVTPPPGSLEVEKNGTIKFSVRAEDPDGDPISVSWILDGTEISNLPDLSFFPEALNITPDRIHDLELNLSAGSWHLTINWSVHVLSPPPVVVEPVPPGVRISSPLDGERFLENETIRLTAESDDSRNLTFRWTLNGSVYEGNNITITSLPPGVYTLTLNVTTEGPPPGWKELSLTFVVVVPEGQPTKLDVDEQSFPWWLLAAIILVILGVLALLILALLKRDDEWYEE